MEYIELYKDDEIKKLKQEIAQLKDELKARKELCDLRYEQLKKQDEEIKVLKLALNNAAEMLSMESGLTTRKQEYDSLINSAKIQIERGNK